jgi:hypothetical protein
MELQWIWLYMNRAMEADLLRSSDHSDCRLVEIAMRQAEPVSLSGRSRSDRAGSFGLVTAYLGSRVCSRDAADLNRMDAIQST